jgi:DTW domain-containing protein YfiP
MFKSGKAIAGLNCFSKPIALTQVRRTAKSRINPPMNAIAEKTDETACPRCRKPPALCICAAVTPLNNRIFVLILRHPQEEDRLLGTAPLAALQLQHSKVKTGLSWPSLSKVLGRDADPKRWGVLYLGTAKTAKPLPQQILTVLTKKGDVAENQNGILKNLEGIVLLDGTWQQAKALWWRNAWMLKCQRLMLQPPRVSLYGNLRKEPRRESVSTLEAAAYTLAALEKDDTLPEKIFPPFRLLLEKAKAARSKSPRTA